MDLWQEFINLKATEEIETKRKKLVFFILSYLSSLFIFYFANYQAHDGTILRSTLNFVGLFIILNALASHFHSAFVVSIFLCSLGVSFLVLFLAYSGGFENTGLYWILPIPIVYFVFFGYIRGLLFNVIIYLAITVILIHPEYIEADYRSAEVSRFLAAYFVTTALSLIAEYFRFKSYLELSILNLNKQKLANTDSLTDLPNRRFVDTVLLEAASLNPEKYFPMTVVVVDIDFFKRINDKYGHDTGDYVLIHLADVLNSNCRGSDIVARIGGEEFLLVFPQTCVSIGTSICEKIRELIEQTPYKSEHGIIQVTASFGVSQSLTSSDFEEAKKQADIMLYQAKSKGRNKVLLG